MRGEPSPQRGGCHQQGSVDREWICDVNQATTNTSWSTRLDHSPATGFLVAGDLLLLTVQSPGREAAPACLLALGHDGGQLHWRHDFENVVIGGLEAVDSPSAGTWLFLTSANRDFLIDEVTVCCYDRSGQQRWQWRGAAQTISAPTFFDGLLSFTVDAELLIHLDAATGAEQLRARLGAPASFAAPRWHDDVAYIPGSGPHLLAIDHSGKQQWRYQAAGTAWLDKTPVIAGERLLAVSSKGRLLALNAANGSQLWQVNVGPAGRPLSSPATDGRRVYVGAQHGLHALDVEDGQILWSFPTERSVRAQPIIYEQMVYVASHDRHLYVLDANNGRELWRYQMDRRIELPPVIGERDNDRRISVYAVDRGGKIVALQQHWSLPAVRTTAEDPVKHENIAEIIEQLESDGELTRAAEVWYEAGDLERAARQFELAGKWLRAADIWRQLGRFLKYAQALEGQAHCIEDEGGSYEELAAAWGEAARAYEAEGEKAKAEYCQLQVAKYKQQPVLDLSIKHDGLALNVWSKLWLTICNKGYGPARRIDIHARGEQFDGRVASSKYYFKLLPGKELTVPLTVRPLQIGASVPMELTLEYQDNKAQVHRMEKKIVVPVARGWSERVEGQMENIFATSPMPATAAKTLTDPSHLVELRRNLAIYFSIDELHDLCFELEIDAEELIRVRKSDFARDIILYLQRRGRLQHLISYCEGVRPHVDW